MFTTDHATAPTGVLQVVDCLTRHLFVFSLSSESDMQSSLTSSDLSLAEVQVLPCRSEIQPCLLNLGFPVLLVVGNCEPKCPHATNVPSIRLTARQIPLVGCHPMNLSHASTRHYLTHKDAGILLGCSSPHLVRPYLWPKAYRMHLRPQTTWVPLSGSIFPTTASTALLEGSFLCRWSQSTRNST